MTNILRTARTRMAVCAHAQCAKILLIFEKISTLLSNDRSLMVTTFSMVEMLPEQFKFKL